MRSKILIIEDENYIREQLKSFLISDYEIFTARDRTEALDIIEHTDLNLVLLDLCIPPDTYSSKMGLDILQRITEMESDTKVIVITGSKDKKDALEAIDMGVYDYISKPFDMQELKILIKRCLHMQKLERENKKLKWELEKRYNFENIIGDCPQMHRIFSIIKKAAPTDYTILIEGETGTGKELVARAIHFHSLRRKGPFVAINCSAIPEQLLESELFGHEKGAFTGAYKTKIGKIELAQKGSLFLDEIGELPLPLQAKLLRFLQELKIERIGRTSPIEVNTRIIAATNKNLEEAVKRGLFREDLYYRLNVISIKLPPLRERGNDILLLADYFSKKYSKGKRFTPEAKRALLQYKWPGNVRELENKIQRAIAMSSNNLISAEDLELDIENINNNQSPLKRAKQLLEREYIIMALRKNNGNITRAAQEIGTNRKSLRRLMQKYGISKEKFIPKYKSV